MTPPAQPANAAGLLFPGQGARYAKMLSEVKDLLKVQAMLRKSRAILGFDVLQIRDRMRLVKLRGEARQEAAEASPQKMLSVAGLERETLEKLYL